LVDNLWQGLIDPKDHPRVYNPEKGFIVSANNFVASKHAKHGITHAFSFTHRFLRLNEMFDQKLKEKGYLNVQDMIDGQLDTVDIQAKLST
jgi:penicillin amidase